MDDTEKESLEKLVARADRAKQVGDQIGVLNKYDQTMASRHISVSSMIRNAPVEQEVQEFD